MADEINVAPDGIAAGPGSEQPKTPPAQGGLMSQPPKQNWTMTGKPASTGSGLGAIITGMVVAVVVFLVLLIWGIVLVNTDSALASLCSSDLGQLGQAFDAQAAAQCSAVSSDHVWGWIMIGIALLMAGGGWKVLSAPGYKRSSARKVVR